MSKVLSTILKTINDVQQKNKKSKTEPTADANVFDLIKGKLNDLESKTKAQKSPRGKSPKGILDLIRKEIESARRENKKDPNVETAPKSVFDQILQKVEAPRVRQASSGLKKIVEEYNLNVSNLPKEIIGQVQQKYVQDRKAFDKQYAQALFDLSKQYK